jgi:hypothetical protein
VAAVHVLIGSLTVVLTWLLARRWGLGNWSWLAAGLLAADPILLNQTAEVMTETCATCLSVLGLLALTRWSRERTYAAALLSGVVSGVVLGLAVLCRPTFLVWAALCGTYHLVTNANWAGIRQTASLVAALAVTVLPWGIRNVRVTGHPIITTTHGGYTLLLANNPWFYEYLRTGKWGSVWDAQELLPLLATVHAAAGEASAEHSEIVADRQLYDRAWATIRQQPATFVWASLYRVGQLWTPWAHQVEQAESRVTAWLRRGAAVWYAVVLLMALVGAWRCRDRLIRTPWVWGTLCVLALSGVHAMYWTNMRMRAPLMPLVVLAAAAAWCAARRGERSL